jgi:hypothetical protein
MITPYARPISSPDVYIPLAPQTSDRGCTHLKLLWMFLYLQILQFTRLINSIIGNQSHLSYKPTDLCRKIGLFDCWNYLKFYGVIQLSAIFGRAQVKIFMHNVYTKPRVCTRNVVRLDPDVCGASGINVWERDWWTTANYKQFWAEGLVYFVS